MPLMLTGKISGRVKRNKVRGGQLPKVSTKPPTDPLEVPYYVHQGRREGSNASDPFHTVGGIGAPLTNPLKLPLMRKIEQQMCAAVQSNIDWKSGNTSVHFNPETGVSIVRLHGNKIAEIDDTSMTIFDGGWQSVTTKSRLNALCDEFCVAGEGVFQKDFAWYVRKFVGAINGQSKFITETFDNGYIFA